MMDMEFEKLRPLMPHVALNTTAATKDQSHQKEGKGYIQHSALLEDSKGDGNRVTALLCNVDELFSR